MSKHIAAPSPPAARAAPTALTTTKHQAHCSIPDFRGVSCRCVHLPCPPEDSTSGVSGKPGAVHRTSVSDSPDIRFFPTGPDRSGGSLLATTQVVDLDDPGKGPLPAHRTSTRARSLKMP